MPRLKIIRASAGSGKTFSLAHEYLRLLLREPDSFMHILAVTFTNKATEEMKTRIIRELDMLSSGKSSKQLALLPDSTGLSEQQIRSKARIILKRLLHNYSRFSISTIDSFFQRIIRGFTRELGIVAGYTIELDTDDVLTWSINELLLKAEKDAPLLAWLTRFAESLIEKGESWDLKKGIRMLGGEIFKEEFKTFGEATLNKLSDRKFLMDYQAELSAIRSKIAAGYGSFGEKARTILESSGLSVEHFNNKQRGPAGFLVKLETGEFRKPTDTAINAAANAEKWYSANSTFKSQIAKVAGEELMPLMQAVIDYYTRNYKTYYTAGVILKNLFTLGILSDLSQLAYQWCNEKNSFLLSEAPVFLHRIIDSNETPFIYEKAGIWYHHYMIDEFQDTSLLQWLNFKPLISNSLSQGYDNLIVGDAKQSIYRWRNSNWEIIEHFVNRDFLAGIASQMSLNTNRRSKKEIVAFNNIFFRRAAEILQEEAEQIQTDYGPLDDERSISKITDLYNNIEQKTDDMLNHGGTVRVDYLQHEEEDDFIDAAEKNLIELLKDLLDKGYKLSDIAILTRKNHEAKHIADFLLRHTNQQLHSGYRFDVISDEALRLGSSTTVTFLITLLRHMVNPTDIYNKYLMQWLLDNYIEAEGDRHSRDGTAPDKAYAVSLPEILEQLIALFRLDAFPGERVYLQAFRDMVMEYSRKNNSTISSFLEYWYEAGLEVSVPAPSGQDAIRILTIHKAKGLEFKITIIPFCTWELVSKNKFIWCSSKQAPFNKLDLFPVIFSSSLKETCFAADYYKEYLQQLTDNLNLLYVAFTRAQEGLFIMCKSDETSHIRNASDLTRRVLGSAPYSAGSVVSGGAGESSRHSVEIPDQPVSLEKIHSRLRIAYQGRPFIDPAIDQSLRPLTEGRILHEILSMIRHTDDIKSSVDRWLYQGKLSREEHGKYLRFLTDSLNDPQVSDWFSGKWQVLTEAEIIIPQGGIKRPDRVMIGDGQTLVIDFKLGTRMDAGYESQVLEYSRLLHNMGYENPEAYLWYIRLGKVVRLVSYL
jgi:ATP-dependent exoDNAse (exonuclease V) beta subunit